MTEFEDIDATLAPMAGYEPVRRICDRCHERIVGPALLRAGKTKGEWRCAACKDKE